MYNSKFYSIARCYKIKADDDKMPLHTEKDLELNSDLLAVVFDAAVVNQVNKNDDCIGGEFAERLVKTLKDKFVNIEHDRSQIIGFIESGKMLDGDWKEVNDPLIKEPYYITLSAILWRLSDPFYIASIVEASNPYSKNYKKLAASWEVRFSDYDIIVGNSDRLDELEIVKDKENYSAYLRANGGTGKMPSGKKVRRLIKGDVLGLGVGFTDNPAANVSGIFLAKKDESISHKKGLSLSKGNEGKRPPYFSNSKKMTKLTDLLEILKTGNVEVGESFATAAEQIINSHFAPIVEEKTALASQVEQLTADKAALSEKVEALAKTVADYTKKERVASRFEAIAKEYNLSDAQKAAITDEVENLDDESYAKWFSTKFTVFASAFKNTAEAPKKSVEQEVVASVIVTESQDLAKRAASFFKLIPAKE